MFTCRAAILLTSNPSQSLFLEKHLKDFGLARIYKAQNLEETNQLLARYSVDVIFADAKMPLNSGFDLAVEMKNQMRETPIVLLVDGIDANFLLKEFSLGVFDILRVPIDETLLKVMLYKVSNFRNIQLRAATFEAFSKDSSLGHILWDQIDSENRGGFQMLVANLRASEKVGQDMSHYVGRIMEESLPDLVNTSFPDHLNKVLADGKPLVIDDFIYGDATLKKKSYDITLHKVGCTCVAVNFTSKEPSAI